MGLPYFGTPSLRHLCDSLSLRTWPPLFSGPHANWLVFRYLWSFATGLCFSALARPAVAPTTKLDSLTVLYFVPCIMFVDSLISSIHMCPCGDPLCVRVGISPKGTAGAQPRGLQVALLPVSSLASFLSINL